jgi:hypothetical protein
VRARDLEEQPRREQDEEHHPHHHRTPVSHLSSLGSGRSRAQEAQLISQLLSRVECKEQGGGNGESGGRESGMYGRVREHRGRPHMGWHDSMPLAAPPISLWSQYRLVVHVF